MAFNILFALASLALVRPVSSQTVGGSEYNNPTAGPPASYFAAATTIPVTALQSAAAKVSTAAKNATYPISPDSGAKRITIHSDWADFNEGAAFVWIADMDVDCDGIDYRCKGNPDGQSQTNFGALAAYEAPFIVIPNTFGTTYPSSLSGNNIAAVICNGNMLYGIYGDSNSDDPEVIGEASWIMARACFPDDNLNGITGHGNPDVTYILFTGNNTVLPSSALNNNYVTNFTTLRSMGDKHVTALVKNLNLGLGGPSPSATTSSGSEPTGSCSWPGHCPGTSCSSADDCSDDMVCASGKCASGSTSGCSLVGHCAGRAALMSKLFVQGLLIYIAWGILLLWL